MSDPSDKSHLDDLPQIEEIVTPLRKAKLATADHEIWALATRRRRTTSKP